MGSGGKAGYAFIHDSPRPDRSGGRRRGVDATVLRVSAVLGSPTFGICSNPFSICEFRTVRYNSILTFNSPYSLSYEEDTQIQMKGRDAVFHHVDRNSLEKAKDKLPVS